MLKIVKGMPDLTGNYREKSAWRNEVTEKFVPDAAAAPADGFFMKIPNKPPIIGK